MKNRKALIATMGYVIGILWGLYCKINITFLYIIILLLITIVNIIKSKKHKFKIISLSRYLKYIKIFIDYKTIMIVIIFSLISNIIVNNLNLKYDTLYNNNDDLQLVANVVSNENVKKNQYIVRVCNENKLKNTKLILKVNENIKLKYGDKIKIYGTFKEPNISRNYKGFNYREYLKTKKIYGIVKSKKIIILKENANGFIVTISNNLFLKIKNNIENLYPISKANLMHGILLGYTENIDEDIKEKFKISNISHILAVSGMHVMYIVIGISFFSNIIGKKQCKIITIIILILYMFVTNFSASVVRAVIMTTIYQVSSIIYRKSDTLTTISVSLLIILIYNPFLLLNVGVLLSYAGTIGIIFFSQNVLIILKKIKIRNKKIRYRFSKKFLKYDLKIKNILAITISAQILIMPITIRISNTISLSFIVTNFLLSFIIGIIVITGFIQILISFISINLSKVISIFLNIFLNILIQISNIGNILPFSKIYLKTPYNIFIFCYYIVVIFLNYLYKIYSLKNINMSQKRMKNILSLLKYKLRKNNSKIKIIVILLVIIILLILVFPRSLRIYFIDVGQGDSTLIKTSLNKTILIDGGGNYSKEYDIGKNTLLPYLLNRRVKKIDYIVVSHFDQDHVRSVF